MDDSPTWSKGGTDGSWMYGRYVCQQVLSNTVASGRITARSIQYLYVRTCSRTQSDGGGGGGLFASDDAHYHGCVLC